MLRTITAIAAVFVLTACSTSGASEAGSQSTAAQPSATQPAATARASQAGAEPPITITGTGIEKSAPFHLNGGTYKVDWTATPKNSGGCYHGATLGAVDPNQLVFEPLGNELLQDANPKSGSTFIYNLDAGDYYVDASSGCDWTFTFTPQ